MHIQRHAVQPAFALLALAAAAGNPLPNPGFEAGAAQWSLAGDAALTPAAARSGRAGLTVGATVYSTAGSSVTSARLPVAVGQPVTLSFQARSRAPCSGAYLWLYDAAGKTVSAPRGLNTACWVGATNNAWAPYSLTVAIPPGVAAVAVWVHSSPGVLGSADYDDFALAGVAPGAATPPPPPRPAKPAAAVDLATLPPRDRPPLVVLKLDDLKQGRDGPHEAWRRVDAVLEERGLRAGYGVICESLADASPAYAAWITARHQAGRVEFWFHGWNHQAHEAGGARHNEFAGWSYDGFKAVLDRSQEAARARLGFAFAACGPTGCGAPGPNLDETALQVLRDDPHIRVALYPTPLDDTGRRAAAGGKLTILDRVWDVNLESAVGVPDLQRLAAGYAAHPERDYFVLQGHPAMWHGERFNEFLRILDFLQAQRAVFVTPSACAAALHDALHDARDAL